MSRNVRFIFEVFSLSLVWFMVLNDTFNNISAISWPSVLLAEETRVPGENHRPVGKSLTNLIKKRLKIPKG